MSEDRSVPASSADTAPSGRPSTAVSEGVAKVGEPLWTRGTAGRVVETVETVLTALILAFVFRAFLVEAFIIPTGSMADSLLGRHGTQVCPVCGWEFEYARVNDALPAYGEPGVPVELSCPNCHYAAEPYHQALKPGDRILVHKWPYELGGPFRPQRWEVIVFRDPADPRQNYIKRLIGLPGETVEIIAGDVYIDGRIQRKTPAAQNALWFVVFDQDHLPSPFPGATVQSLWVADVPGPPGATAGWMGLNSRRIRYRGLDRMLRTVAFNPRGVALYEQDVYGYNQGSSGAYVGDVCVSCEVAVHAGSGACRWEIERGEDRFWAVLNAEGRASLLMGRSDQPGFDEIRAAPLRAFRLGRPMAIEFGHLDYRVYLKVDGEEVFATTDTEYGPDLDALRRAPDAPRIRLGMAATAIDFELRHLRVERDVHYAYRPGVTQRAYPGNPFTLGPDEHFVLGDNSPQSHDSREWHAHGPQLPRDYRDGTVLSDQIVGRAAFVYLSGLLPIDAAGRWRTPDLGRVRFIR